MFRQLSHFTFILEKTEKQEDDSGVKVKECLFSRDFEDKCLFKPVIDS